MGPVAQTLAKRAAPCQAAARLGRPWSAAPAKEQTLQAEELAHRVVELTLERKAQDVVTIDVRGRVSYADFLVVATGTSDRHVQAIAESAAAELNKAGVRILGREGLREGQWALVDLGDVVLHVFHPYTRESIDMDTLWRDAPKTRAEQPSTGPSAAIAD